MEDFMNASGTRRLHFATALAETVAALLLLSPLLAEDPPKPPAKPAVKAPAKAATPAATKAPAAGAAATPAAGRGTTTPAVGRGTPATAGRGPAAGAPPVEALPRERLPAGDRRQAVVEMLSAGGPSQTMPMWNATPGATRFPDVR